MRLRLLLTDLNDKNLYTLYEEYRKPIFLYILSIVKNSDLAEDLTQEVYIRIIEYHDTYQPIYNPKTWLFTIAKNVCYTYFQKKKEIPLNHEILLPLLDDKFATSLEESYLIRDYLSNLNEIDQKIIILHIFGGLKHYEIAKILNMTYSNVRVRYHKLLRQLEKEIQNEKN